MVFPLIRKLTTTLATQGSRTLHRSSVVGYIKDYDKKVPLLPEDVKYDPKDKRFLPGPHYADNPYPETTPEEREELTRIKLEDEVYHEQITKVDPNSAPFNEVLADHEDTGKFTKAEVIPDNDERWFWVDRLMPKTHLDKPIREGSLLITPLPKTAPNLPYYVARTRSRVYPLYRQYEVVGRDPKTYWKNRWDGLFNKYTSREVLVNLDSIKYENNEKTIIITEVAKIQGDIWQFEVDARKFLEEKHPDGNHILSAVNEVRSIVQFKGDFIAEMHTFLRQCGF